MIKLVRWLWAGGILVCIVYCGNAAVAQPDACMGQASCADFCPEGQGYNYYQWKEVYAVGSPTCCRAVHPESGLECTPILTQ